MSVFQGVSDKYVGGSKTVFPFASLSFGAHWEKVFPPPPIDPLDLPDTP
jgi:hypothetical protein